MIVWFLAGAATAAVYVWLLNKTVTGLVKVSRPAFAAFAGFAARLALCAGCFCLSAIGGHIERVIVCLAGFAVARAVAIRVIKAAYLTEGEHEHKS
jgi:F1F0 ATPase subunit 2